MWWWVALLVAIVGPQAAHTHMLLDYEHLEPKTLPWAEGAAEQRLDPQVAEVRLAMTVVETARALKEFAAKPESQFATQTPDLEAKVKGEVYRKVLRQSLAHSRRAYKHLSSVGTKGPKDAILRQWLAYLSGPDLVHRILYSLTSDQNPSCENELVKKQPNPNDQKNTSEAKIEKPVGEAEDLSGEEVRSPSDRRSGVGEKKVPQDLLSILMGAMLQQVSVLSNHSTNKRHRRSDQGLMYLPVGGTTKVQCPTAADAAGISITQMAFLSISLTVFNIIVNINNNINNNNNNNNINSDNNLSNNNAQLSLNVNNAGQVNVMLPPPIPGRKRRASLREVWQRESKDSTLNLTLWAQNLETEDALSHILQKQGIRVNDEESITVKSAESRTVSMPDYALLGQEARHENQSAATEPSVGDAFDDFSLPTPLPGVLSIQGKNSDAKKLSYKAEGIATGILQAIKTWVSDSPLLSLECRGLLWCRKLKEASDRHKWLLILASYSAHQRTQGNHSLSLTQFVKSALAQDICQHLFPTCRNTAAL